MISSEDWKKLLEAYPYCTQCYKIKHAILTTELECRCLPGITTTTTPLPY